MRIRSILTLNTVVRWPSLITLFCSAFLCPLSAQQTINLTWPPNRETNIAGYIVYYGVASGTYTNATDVGLATTNTVTGLAQGVTYYFGVSAYDSNGLESAATEVTNTVPVVVPPKYTPVAGTLTPTVNNSTSAVLKAAVNPNGAETIAWFQYGYTTGYGSTTGLTNLGSAASTIWMNASLTGLLPGQTYHYRVVASNSVGLTNGTDMTFTMPADLPGLATLAATAVNETGATLNASVNPNGGATLVWFEYGTNTSYGTSTAGENVPSGNSAVAVNTAINGLLSGTTYHYRIAAKNSAGIAYGADGTFVTPQRLSGTTVTLAWPPNRETNIVGYNIYYGPASGVYTNVIDAGNVTNYTVSGLVSGATYFFGVTAYDSFGLESALSTEVSVTVGPVATQPIAGTVSTKVDSSTSVLMSAQVNPNGAPTTVWFQYGLDTSYGKVTGMIPVGSGTDMLSVDISLGGLLPGATYHYRVVASNSLGMTFGSDSTFVTLARPPTANALAASDITSVTATLNASVNPGGADTWYYFEYGVDASYGVITPWKLIPAGSTNVVVSLPVNQLLAGTLYHFRVSASNSLGSVTGVDSTFTTVALPPQVTTEPPDTIGLTAANVNGSVDPNGANTTVWFEYGANTNYSSRTATANVGASDGQLAFSAQLTNLASSATYHYRMVASNSLGVTYGADVVFTTLSVGVDVTTLPATEVSSTSAILQGAANPNNAPCSVWFEYGLTTSYGFSTPVQNIGAENGFVSITSGISNLQPGQTWHYRLVATNSAGRKYGADMTFATPMTDLAATTLPTRWVKSTTAALCGSVTPMAYPATAYFEYGTTTDFTATSSSVPINAGTTPVSVSKRIYNLTSGVTYYYRVVATNKYDKVYGQILSFSTR